MWKIGIAIVINVYMLIALCTLIAIKITKKLMCKENGLIPIKKTVKVIILTLSIYLIPIIGLSLCLVYCEKAIGFIILAIFISAFPLAEYVIIPLSYKDRAKITEK